MEIPNYWMINTSDVFVRSRNGVNQSIMSPDAKNKKQSSSSSSSAENDKNTNTCKKLRHFQSYMNVKALGNAAYVPTEVEHIANIVSHGFCVIPALAGLLHMLRLPGWSTS